MEEAAEAIAWRKQPKREDLDASWKASWKEKKCTGLVTSCRNSNSCGRISYTQDSLIQIEIPIQ
jgi:hypothetical protein